jgi:hypothetical protein
MYFIYFEHLKKRELLDHAEDEKAAKALLTELAMAFIIKKEGELRADKRWLETTADAEGYWIKHCGNSVELYKHYVEETTGVLWTTTYIEKTDLVGSWSILRYDMSLTDPFKELLESRDQLTILKSEIISAKKECATWKEKYQSRAGAKIAEAYSNEPETPVEVLATHFKSKVPPSTETNVRALGALVQVSLTENERFLQMRRKCEDHTVGGK